MSLFVPRNVFPTLDALPRSYFLGHHRAGLEKMKTMLTYIDLVIECRDYRVPITSRNPLFEESLAGRERLIVYTKQDLGSEGKREDKSVCSSQMAVSTYAFADHWRRGREKRSYSNGTGRPQCFSPTTGTGALYVKCWTLPETTLVPRTLLPAQG